VRRTVQRVLITGASSGVGAAAAVAFARDGADVALVARSEAGLREVASRVRACGRQALVLPVDVTDQDALDAAVARVETEWGGLDVAIANAAAMAFGRFDQVPKRDFDRTVEATFLGSVNLARAVLPALERSGGTLLFLGSINAMTPLPSFSAYAASKAAQRSFARSLRIELRARRSQVRVALVHPGAISTPVWKAVTSATGRLPRRPPEGYRPDEVARGLVRSARSGSPVERVVGGEARFWLRIWRTPVLGDLVLTLVHRYYHSGRRPATDDPLWEAHGDGTTDGLPIGRPSVLARLLRSRS
jgi:NAD(P)-dependent dehydrogenase (short-subunit alcohol dehydrogenase family)